MAAAYVGQSLPESIAQSGMPRPLRAHRSCARRTGRARPMSGPLLGARCCGPVALRCCALFSQSI
eukprot:9967210-Lingulodinium_polyedra.AAC.1